MSRNPHFHNLICNEYYRKLKPTLDKNTRQRLKDEIILYGCREPIIAWRYVILDGYKRFEICRELGISCKTKSINFDIEEEAVAWICRRELKRPHLSEGYQKYYIGKLYHAQKKIYATLYPTQNQSTPKDKKRPPIDFSGDCRNYTATVVGQEFGIGAGSVYKYSIFADEVDIIMRKAPDIARIILVDHIHVSHNAVSALAVMPKADINKIRSCFSDESMFRLQLTDIESVLNSKRLTTKPVSKVSEPEIKQVPKYDPDAEISSLTLTMPSWVSSIYRTCNTAPFHLISGNAKKNLHNQLSELQVAIDTIKRNLEDTYHE